MDLNFFTISSFAIYGVLSNVLPLHYKHDHPSFAAFKKEVESHIPTIQHAGLDFYSQKDIKKILSHCASIVGYEIPHI